MFQISKTQPKTSKALPCTYYNQGTCSFARTHDTKGVTYKHICAACFAMGGKTYPHPENECRTKNRKKCYKKQIGRGMEVPGHALTYKTRMFHNNILSNSKLEYQASKNLAFKWFYGWKTYQKTVPGKTYAQALSFGQQFTHTSRTLHANSCTNPAV